MGVLGSICGHQMQQHRRLSAPKDDTTAVLPANSPVSASSRMPCASRSFALSCSAARCARADRQRSSAPAARAQAALGVDDGDVAHSQPICTTSSRTFCETSCGERPSAAPFGAGRAQFLQPRRPFRAELLRQPFAQRPRQARHRPPVEAVSSRSPRRTMAGTWKSHRWRQHPRHSPGRPRPRALPARFPGLALRQAGHEQELKPLQKRVRDVAGSSRTSTPASASRAARRSARRPGRPDRP